MPTITYRRARVAAAAVALAATCFAVPQAYAASPDATNGGCRTVSPGPIGPHSVQWTLEACATPTSVTYAILARGNDADSHCTMSMGQSYNGSVGVKTGYPCTIHTYKYAPPVSKGSYSVTINVAPEPDYAPDHSWSVTSPTATR